MGGVAVVVVLVAAELGSTIVDFAAVAGGCKRWKSRIRPSF